LQRKYVSDPSTDQNLPKKIIFSGKVAEEVGFDKVSRKQAQLGELQFVILDDFQVAYASHPDGVREGAEDGQQSIGQVCPKVRELDLSRNLFERFGTVAEICSELRSLRSLRVKYASLRLCLESCFFNANIVILKAETGSNMSWKMKSWNRQAMPSLA
jgi:hypothetical protein